MTALACLAIGVGVLLAYANSFQGAFVFDDAPAILDNPAVRHPTIAGLLSGAAGTGGETTHGRPIVTLSLAGNFALSAERAWSYHVVNVLIHALAALTLFGVLRRTAGRLPRAASGGVGRETVAILTATVAATLWALHPLQTEAVTYVVQRAESLMGLFYLLTLYAFLRAVEGAWPGRWLTLSVVVCALGMATKEVMVSAPLTVLLYDRVFIAGTFREAWRRRGRYYLGLAATWLILAALVLSTESRGGTAGFATTVGPWPYLLTQCRAIVHYLWLTMWPHPLVFDYGTGVAASLADVFFHAIALTMLGVATLWALWRGRPIGIAGFGFFAILAPSSSVVPIASQTMAEHRMYLPLAVVVSTAVLGLQRWLGPRALLAGSALAAAAAIVTWQRNIDYRGEERLWTDTVAKMPANARAHHNLGRAALNAGRPEAALTTFQTAAQLQPRAAETHYDLGICLARLGRHADAVAAYERSLALDPKNAEAHNNLGNALLAMNRLPDARVHYEEAARLKPRFAEAHSNLGNALLQLGQAEAALRHCDEALRLKPDYTEAHYNAGNACAELRRLPDARAHYEAALRLKPDYAAAHNNLANIFLELDQPADALSHYRSALEIDSDYLDPRRNLALLLVHLGRYAEALPHLERLATAYPTDPAIRSALGEVRAAMRR